MSTKFKGTKGNWYLQQYTDAYNNIIRCNSGEGFETKYIASTPQSMNPEHRHNAKLMSTAPRLLEMLEDCVHFLSEIEVPEHLKETYGNLIMNAGATIDDATNPQS